MSFDVYTRVSDEGGRAGTAGFGSPEVQEAAARAWIVGVGADVGDVFYEGNVSGGLAADERGLGGLIRRIESGDSEGIVVRAEDRFARDVLEGGKALKRIVDAGGRLVATMTGFDSANLNPQSQMMFNMLMAIAQAQRETNRDSYIAGKKRAADRGVYGARAPFGYDKGDDGVLMPNGDAETVRRVFGLRAQGMGFSEITRELRLPSRGAPRQIVRNRAYVGEQVVPGRRKGEPVIVADSIPRIVTNDEWEDANRVQGRAPIRRGLIHMVRFKGLVNCGLCGRSVSVNGYGPDRMKLTYVCTRKGCGGAAMAASKLEPLLLGAVRTALEQDEPHVAATLADDDRYERALANVAQALQSLAEFRDNIELQQVLGIQDFAAGLRVRLEAVAVARRALADTPRPTATNTETRAFDETNLNAEYAAYETALVRRVVKDVSLFPRTADHRLTLTWHGAEDSVPVEYVAA